MTQTKTKKQNMLLISAIIFIAFNLRAAITGVGSLLAILQEALQLSSGAAGFITTIPLLAFAAVSPLVSRTAAKLGEGITIAAALVIMIAGLLVRSYLGAAGLFAGTALAGIGVAFGNVLLPSIIKGCFPEKEAMLTGVYTASMSFFASVAAGVSIPLANAFGWNHSMAVWVILAAVTLLIWLPFLGMRLGGEGDGRAVKGMYKHPVAVWLSLFMGLQCVFFYCFVSWLPSILEVKGFDTETAGYLFSLYQIVGIPAALVTPLAAGGNRDQRKPAAALMILYGAGMAAVTFGRGGALITFAVVICGFCSGACISLAMLMINTRTKEPAAAGQLSGLVQSAGYLIAAAGPFAMGLIFDMTADWTVTLAALMALLAPLAVSAIKSGEDRYIE